MMKCLQLALGLKADPEPLATLKLCVPAFVELAGYESAHGDVFEIIRAAIGTDAEALLTDTINGISEAWTNNDLAAARGVVTHPFQQDLAEALLVGPEELQIVLGVMRAQIRPLRRNRNPGMAVRRVNPSLLARWNQMATEYPVVDPLPRKRGNKAQPPGQWPGPRPTTDGGTADRSAQDGFRHALLVHIAVLDARGSTRLAEK